MEGYLIHLMMRSKKLTHTSIKTDSLPRRQLTLIKLLIDTFGITRSLHPESPPVQGIEAKNNKKVTKQREVNGAGREVTE
jgi:hypothetical protein